MDTNKARELLHAERRRLVGITEGRDDVADTPAPGDVPDQGADAAHRTFDREMSESVEGYAETEIGEIDAALQRIEDGTYGVCEVGGEEIGDERLEAMPATRYCVKHQEEMERRKEAGGYEGADPTI